MPGLALYSLENARTALEEHARNLSVPWALVKPKFFEFVAALRQDRIYVTEALDIDTAEQVQEALFVDGKNLELAVEDGLRVLNQNAAQDAIGARGQKSFGPLWGSMQEVVTKFLCDLYRHNVFLAVAGERAARLIDERTKTRNVVFRIAKEPSCGTNP